MKASSHLASSHVGLKWKTGFRLRKLFLFGEELIFTPNQNKLGRGNSWLRSLAKFLGVV
jgi:hypothetical protein